MIYILGEYTEDENKIIGTWTDENTATDELTECIAQRARDTTHISGYISHEIAEDEFFILGFDGKECKCCICMENYKIKKCIPDNHDCT